MAEVHLWSITPIPHPSEHYSCSLPWRASLPKALQEPAHCYREQSPNSQLPFQCPYQNRLWHYFHLLLILDSLPCFSEALLLLVLFNSNQECTGCSHMCRAIQSHPTSPWLLSSCLACSSHLRMGWINEWTMLLGKQRMPCLEGDQSLFLRWILMFS